MRVRNGKVMTTDGPFAETREQLGGYYLVEAKNLDEATAIAARIPGARQGSIEVRPVYQGPLRSRGGRLTAFGMLGTHSRIRRSRKYFAESRVVFSRH